MALPAGRYGVTKRQLNKVKNLPVNTIGMIEEVLETSKEYTDDAIGWGSANIFNADALFATASHHGISLSISNQIVGLIGTVSSDVGYYFGDVNKTLMLPAGTYTFSIVVSGSFGTASEIRLRKRSDSSKIVGIFTNDVKPVSFTLDTDTEVFIAIVNSNATVGTSVNATLKIQLEKGSTATAYEPYHASVDESKCDNSTIAPTENDTTASQAYAVGEHFIRNGAFCTVTQAISSGGTLTEGTNYTSGAVGDFIYRNVLFETVSLPVNGYHSWTIPTITGYIPIMVTPMVTGSGAISGCLLKVLSNTTPFDKPELVAVYNLKDESVTWTISANILYIKS